MIRGDVCQSLSGAQQRGFVTAQRRLAPSQRGFVTAQRRLAPSQRGFVAAQRRVAPSQRGFVAAQRRVAPSQCGVVAAQRRVAPSQCGVVAAQRRLAPSQRGFVAAQRRLAPSQRGVVAAQRRLAPSQRGVVAAQRRLAPSQRGVVAAQRRLAPSQRGVVAAQRRVAPSQCGVVAAQRRLAPSQRGVVAAQRRVAPSQRGVVAAQRRVAPLQREVGNDSWQWAKALPLPATCLDLPGRGGLGRGRLRDGSARMREGFPSVPAGGNSAITELCPAGRPRTGTRIRRAPCQKPWQSFPSARPNCHGSRQGYPTAFERTPSRIGAGPRSANLAGSSDAGSPGLAPHKSRTAPGPCSVPGVAQGSNAQRVCGVGPRLTSNKLLPKISQNVTRQVKKDQPPPPPDPPPPSKIPENQGNPPTPAYRKKCVELLSPFGCPLFTPDFPLRPSHSPCHR